MSENYVDQSQDQKLQQVIKENHNFNAINIAKKAFTSIRGSKHKFFLASLIILVINAMLFLLLVGPMYYDLIYQDFMHPSNMTSVGFVVSFILISIMNIILGAGISRITLRHLRHRHNPILEGLFSFFPIMRKVILIYLFLAMFVFTPYLAGIFLLSFIENSFLSLLLTITLSLIFFSIALLYSFIFFIMADHPTMGFWRVLESSRKLIMNRWLKIGIFYLILIGAIYMLIVSTIELTTFIIFMFPWSGVLSLFLIIGILLLWLIPFIEFIHGWIYLHLVNDACLYKNK